MTYCPRIRPWSRNNRRGTEPDSRDGSAIAAAVAVRGLCTKTFCKAVEIPGTIKKDLTVKIPPDDAAPAAS
jgi:hypothetical protein